MWVLRAGSGCAADTTGGRIVRPGVGATSMGCAPLQRCGRDATRVRAAPPGVGTAHRGMRAALADECAIPAGCQPKAQHHAIGHVVSKLRIKFRKREMRENGETGSIRASLPMICLMPHMPNFVHAGRGSGSHLLR